MSKSLCFGYEYEYESSVLGIPRLKVAPACFDANAANSRKRANTRCCNVSCEQFEATGVHHYENIIIVDITIVIRCKKI